MNGLNWVSAVARYTFEVKLPLGKVDLIPVAVEANDVARSRPNREAEHGLIAVTRIERTRFKAAFNASMRRFAV